MKVSELIARLSDYPELSDVEIITDEDINDRYTIEDIFYVKGSKDESVILSTEFTFGG